MNNPTGAAPLPLHWEDLPLILISSLIQAVVVGILAGLLFGAIVSAFGLGHTLINAEWIAPPLGVLFYGVLVVAGLKPMPPKEIMLELPKAHRPD